jgi:quaternary ammonium compound-resistance protein SugE
MGRRGDTNATHATHVFHIFTKKLPMNWWILVIAGFFEAGFALCLGQAKLSNGLERNFWLSGFFICLTISMYLLYKATLTLPVGTAYAVWTGIGATVTVTAGMIFFKEPVEFWRLFFITCLISSIIGLRFVTH